MEAQAPFDWPAGKVMLHTVTKKDLGAPIIHPHGHRYRKDSLGPFAPSSELLIEIQEVGHSIKLLRCHGKDRALHKSFFHEAIPNMVETVAASDFAAP